MITPRPERFAIGGRDLEFVRIEPERAKRPWLVFLHEGLGSLALWRDFPAALARRTGCGAFVYSRYGNGFSTTLREARTPAYMHEEAREALPALLEAASIRQAILFGQSDGGSIALIFAAEHPSTTRGLILEAPHLFVEALSIRSITRIKSEYQRGALRERMASHHDDVDRTFYGWNDVWLAPEFAQWNIESSVRRVRAPVLAMQGLDDEYGTAAQIDAIAAHATGPVDRVLLANCGHAPHRERAALVEGAAAAWIEELLAA
ncbi:MAG: alpha/beta hydrolase [Candidatus Eremiobacteraeota bacterium]|nr:alpha/beta hydrolase [Candidatus Eremiobacteraeota bacterium]